MRVARRSAAVCIFGLSLAYVAAAQVHRHGLFEAALTAARDYADPLRDVEVTVEFRGPGGALHEARAFWDGERVWKVRFSPETPGEWMWRSRSSNPSDAGLEGRTGRFRVTAYRGPNELYRRGAPRLSANRRYFVHADGTPWFFLSDTAWNGALLSTREEWERYLAHRVSKRFTAVQFVLTQWRAGRADELGQVAFTGTDRIQIHPRFFQRMDAKFEAINRHGLVAVPVLLWALSSKDKESPGAWLPTDQAILLARYMVARYGAFHVIWFLGGDGDYRGANAERWKAIGRAVFPPGEPRRPVTLHPQGMQSPWPEYKDEPWLDFFLYQSGHGSDARKWRWNATEGPAKDWRLDPPRPVIDGEPNYEGHLSYHARARITDADVRRAVYYSLLAAPPAGVSYGAHGIWFWARKPEVPLDHPNTGVADPWWECLDYPGAHQMKILRDVFDSVEWWKLRPDRTLLAEDVQDPEFRAYIMPARSEDGRFALLYLPANPTVKLDLASFRGPVRGEWIDPRTGARSPAGRWEPIRGVELKAPAEGDWLLLLRQ
ncbi:MAG: DUF4038 domain-containing protein [Bryobacteraceae bacterium]|nr:DUF4038 domain-containing protein [Bryobacteraceae bacterium]